LQIVFIINGFYRADGFLDKLLEKFLR